MLSLLVIINLFTHFWGYTILFISNGYLKVGFSKKVITVTYDKNTPPPLCNYYYCLIFRIIGHFGKYDCQLLNYSNYNPMLTDTDSIQQHAPPETSQPVPRRGPTHEAVVL